MIDDDALKILLALHKRAEEPPVCVVAKGIAYVHSLSFVLELPEKEIQLKKQKWPGVPFPGITEWRTLLPADPKFVKAMAAHETVTTGEDVVVLTAFNGDDRRFMQVGFYEFFREQLDHAVFKIMAYVQPSGLPTGIGVFDDKKWVGAVSAYLPPGL